MNAPTSWKELAPDLFLFADACNVYLLHYGDLAIAVDFGTGQWLAHLDEIGVAQLENTWCSPTPIEISVAASTSSATDPLSSMPPPAIPPCSSPLP